MASSRARVRRSVKQGSITVTPSRPTRNPMLFSPHDPGSCTYASSPSCTSSAICGRWVGLSWSAAGAAPSAALRISALDDELGNNTVEREAVVEAVACERDEVVHRVRRELRVELHHDRAAVGVDRDLVDGVLIDLHRRWLSHPRTV